MPAPSLVEQQSQIHKSGLVPLGETFRSSCPSDPALSIAAEFQRRASTAQRLQRHVPARLRSSTVVQGDGPETDGSASHRRRYDPGQHRPDKKEALYAKYGVAGLNENLSATEAA